MTEAGNVVWYVRPASGGQFGPAGSEVMRAWIAEGRVSADSLVWREGWRDWQEASEVLPQLRVGQTAAPLGGFSTGTNPASPATVARGNRTMARRRSRSTQVALIVLLIVAVLILLAVLIWVWSHDPGVETGRAAGPPYETALGPDWFGSVSSPAAGPASTRACP